MSVVTPNGRPRLIDLFKARLAQGYSPEQAAAILGYDRQFAVRMMTRIAREAEASSPEPTETQA